MSALMHMSPVAAIVWRVFFAYAVAAYLGKLVANEGGRLERFVLQFVFTAFFACILAWYAGGLDYSGQLWIVVSIGFIAASGTFFKWKAIAISQSKDALFTFWDDIIAMGLGVFILGEGRFVTLPIAGGIVLSFLSVALFMRRDWMHKKNGGVGKGVPLRFYAYVGFYSLCWGLAVFGQRYYSFKDMPVPTFIFGWYSGTLAASVMLFLFHPEAKHRAFAINGKGALLVFLLAIAVFMSLALASVSYRLPVVEVQPIFLVAELIMPALIGLFVFHERKNFDAVEWLYFGIGIAGALTVGFSI